MGVTGSWNLEIKTPIGTQHVVLTSSEQRGVGGNRGRSRRTVRSPNRLWLEVGSRGLSAITKPLRLDLRFDVEVDGDTMSGTSKAAVSALKGHGSAEPQLARRDESNTTSPNRDTTHTRSHRKRFCNLAS